MRSRLMLEVASELVAADEWPERQVTVHFRPQGDDAWRLCFFASDAPNAVDAIVRGAADVAICNPGGVLAMALRGAGPFREPVPPLYAASMPIGPLPFAVHSPRP